MGWPKYATEDLLPHSFVILDGERGIRQAREGDDVAAVIGPVPETIAMSPGHAQVWPAGREIPVSALYWPGGSAVPVRFAGGGSARPNESLKIGPSGEALGAGPGDKVAAVVAQPHEAQPGQVVRVRLVTTPTG